MKSLLLMMAFAVGLSASPIVNGSCNGGGTALEFSLLFTGGCRPDTNDWVWSRLTSTYTAAELDAITLSYISDAPNPLASVSYRISTTLTGFFPVGSFTVRWLSVMDNQPGCFSCRLQGFEGGPSTPIGVTREFDIFSVNTPGQYSLSYTFSNDHFFETPEPGTYALMGAGLAVVMGLRRRKR